MVAKEDCTGKIPLNGVAAPTLFGIGTLVLGFAVAGWGYASGSVPDAGVRRPPICPLDWMFWAIWLVLYPTMGVASYHLWRCRHLPGSGLAWRWYLVGFAANLTWVPVVHLTQSPVAAPAVMDALAGLLMLPAYWAVTRSNRAAYRWLIPMLIWGPITGSLKIWQLSINRDLFTDQMWVALRWAIYAGAAEIAMQLSFLIRGAGLKEDCS